MDLFGRVESLLEVGTGFHPELTGRGNIFLNGAVLGMKRAEIDRKFDDIVAFAEVEKFIDTAVKHYSSGMYMRLAFSVAAHLEPEILLVDEVLAVGDMEFQKKCMGKMSEIGQQGRTVIFVSHNMTAIADLCRSGVLLTGGRARYFTNSADCISQYISEGWGEPTADVSFDQHPRPSPIFLSERARLLGARLASGSRSGPWQIPFGTPPEFELTIEVVERVSDLEFGMAICNAAGVEFASPMSSDSMSPVSLTAGKYVIHALLKTLVLVPGRYLLGLGLRSQGGMEDYLPEALQFEVVGAKVASYRRPDARRGFLIPEMTYEIRPAQ